MSRLVSMRLDDDLAGWAATYAKERGVSRSQLIEQALQSFREDCQRGVPDLSAPEPPAPPSQPVSVRSLVPKLPGLVVASSLVGRDRDALARQAKLNAAKGRSAAPTPKR